MGTTTTRMAPSDFRQGSGDIGEGLTVVIDGRSHPVLALSLTGVHFQAAGYAPGQTVALRLADPAEPSNAVDGQIRVVASDAQSARGDFFVTMRLLRFVIRRMSRQSGVEPTYFR